MPGRTRGKTRRARGLKQERNQWWPITELDGGGSGTALGEEPEDSRMDFIRKSQKITTLAQTISGQQRVCFIIEVGVEVPNWRDKTVTSHVHKAVWGAPRP